MKKITMILFFVAIVCSVLFVGLNYKENYKESMITTNKLNTSNGETTSEESFADRKDSNNSDLNVCDQVRVSLDLVTIYEDENEKINDDSLIIVSGEVKKTEVILCDVVFTCCTVEIDEVLKGETDYNEILVLELGGYLNSEQAEKFISKDGAKCPNGLSVVYMDYETANVGDKVILYLYECEPVESIYNEIDGKRAYHIAGAVQGKMTLKDNKYISDTPESIAEPYSFTQNELIAKINELK